MRPYRVSCKAYVAENWGELQCIAMHLHIFKRNRSKPGHRSAWSINSCNRLQPWTLAAMQNDEALIQSYCQVRPTTYTTISLPVTWYSCRHTILICCLSSCKKNRCWVLETMGAARAFLSPWSELRDTAGASRQRTRYWDAIFSTSEKELR